MRQRRIMGTAVTIGLEGISRRARTRRSADMTQAQWIENSPVEGASVIVDKVDI
jgi:uncharacterized membrane protein